MIGISELSDIISRVFYNEVRNSGRVQQQVCCPRCAYRANLPEGDSDGKFNLEINLARHQFKCWKCDPKFSGSLMYLIKKYGSPEDYAEYKNFVTIFGFSIEEWVDEDKIERVFLPKEIIFFKDMIDFLPEHQEPYMYLINERKLTHETILNYNMGFCLEGPFKNRIIVPSYDRFGRVNYFVGRGFKKKMKPTYRNPEVNKDSFIINEKNINWDSTLYIVEGMFDLLSVPLNTTASLGKTLSTALYNKLKEKKPYVIVLYDPDAYQNMIDVYELIFHMYGDKHSHKVRMIDFASVVPPDTKDIDDVRKIHGIEMVRDLLRTARQLTELDYSKLNGTNNTYKFDYIHEPRRYGFGEIDFANQ